MKENQLIDNFVLISPSFLSFSKNYTWSYSMFLSILPFHSPNTDPGSTWGTSSLYDGTGCGQQKSRFDTA